jgi:hypothetical protein
VTARLVNERAVGASTRAGHPDDPSRIATALLDDRGTSMVTRLAMFEAEPERAAARPLAEVPWSIGRLLGHAVGPGPLESPATRT